MDNEPKTEHDWRVRALNIHGIFFERWCERVVADTLPWQVKSTNYPVEFPRRTAHSVASRAHWISVPNAEAGTIY